jgi:hypothetical protein
MKPLFILIAFFLLRKWAYIGQAPGTSLSQIFENHIHKFQKSLDFFDVANGVSYKACKIFEILYILGKLWKNQENFGILKAYNVHYTGINTFIIFLLEHKPFHIEILHFCTIHPSLHRYFFRILWNL